MGIDVGPIEVTDGLVFHLDAGNSRSYSGSGLTAYGLVGGIGGTLVNGVGFSSANGGSFFFDGTNDYINLGNSISNTYSSLTVESIFNIGITNKKQAIISTYLSNIGWGIEVLDNTYNNKFNFFGFTSSGISTGVLSSSSTLINQNYHIAVVYTGSSSFSLYINGVFDNTVSTNFVSISKGSSANLQLGDDPDSNSVYFQGNIYSAKLYNRALSAQEILQNYNATKGRYGL